MWRTPGMMVLILLCTGIVAHPVWALDPVLQQAQQKLSHLGYDLGVADGIYGPRTKQALEAFQRAQHLPVTGVLNTATLEALARATSPTPEAEPPVLPPQHVPLRIVLTYLRFYDYQPARVLPYVTEHFRHGLTPQEWIEQTLETLTAQEYAYLDWKVRHIEVSDTQATVEVHTRVQVQGQEITRQEMFSLQRTAGGDWLIDDWHIEALPVDQERPQTGS
jgi:hypothetical protein